MKITEELLEKMKVEDENFSDGLILPDGDYIRIPKGHLHGMMALLPCVLTDYNNSIGMKMTVAQQKVFDAMRKHGILTDDYYDLTKQREKARKEREQNIRVEA